jgi:hypothetical protein
VLCSSPSSANVTREATEKGADFRGDTRRNHTIAHELGVEDASSKKGEGEICSPAVE